MTVPIAYRSQKPHVQGEERSSRGQCRSCVSVATSISNFLAYVYNINVISKNTARIWYKNRFRTHSNVEYLLTCVRTRRLNTTHLMSAAVYIFTQINTSVCCSGKTPFRKDSPGVRGEGATSRVGIVRYRRRYTRMCIHTYTSAAHPRGTSYLG